MILALMVPNLSKIGILIDFKINQDFIAKVLCINREKPMSTCNGKCYLSEQLKKVEEQEEKQAPTNKKERLEVVYYFATSSYVYPLYINSSVSKLNPAWVVEFFTSTYIATIFHPPKFNLI
ncbi:hypothetical protein CEN47_03890 [Fischerella thermalis CCMEE 5319]|nr:hypothetical protein CEN47_03890 [Fischerella thermalis CCMEE 5319]